MSNTDEVVSSLRTNVKAWLTAKIQHRYFVWTEEKRNITEQFPS